MNEDRKEFEKDLAKYVPDSENTKSINERIIIIMEKYVVLQNKDTGDVFKTNHVNDQYEGCEILCVTDSDKEAIYHCNMAITITTRKYPKVLRALYISRQPATTKGEITEELSKIIEDWY